MRDLEYFSKMYPGSTNDDILPGIYLIMKFKKFLSLFSAMSIYFVINMWREIKICKY